MKLLFCSKKGSFSDNKYPRNTNFGVKVYKPCDETGYMYDMTVYSFLDGGEEISHSDSPRE
jgi:hypothetical protein